MREAVRYSGVMTMRCQPEMVSLVDQVATSKGMKASEYARQALTAALQRDGADPALVARSKSAGELYDRLSDGSRRWALVVDGSVADLSYQPSDPNEMPDQKELGRTWLPVRHEDSEPFDAFRHWRLKPEARIDGDQVVVTFPVIAKSEGV